MRRRVYINVAGAVLFVLGAVWQAEADVITNVITANADTLIQSATPDTNYGSQSNIDVYDFTTQGRKSYVRFNLSGVTVPISSATLSLSVQLDGASSVMQYIDVYGLNDGDSGESWVESAVNWDNAPQNDTGDFGALLSGVTYLGQLAIDAPNLNPHDIVTFSSAALASFLADDTDGQATIILSGASNTGHYTFYSREVAGTVDDPTLTVTSIPEPATVSLFMISGVGVLFARKIMVR